MTDFGGIGGVPGGRKLNQDDLFEMAVWRALEADMRADPDLCAEVWGSLASVKWTHENGDTASYSFRAAGDLVAAVIGRGNYMDWYCSAPHGRVNDRVAEAMAREGWTGAPNG